MVECTSVKGQGLFIIHKSDVFIFPLCISDEILETEADCFIAMLCLTINKFIDVINSHEVL